MTFAILLLYRVIPQGCDSLRYSICGLVPVANHSHAACIPSLLLMQYWLSVLMHDILRSAHVGTTLSWHLDLAQNLIWPMLDSLLIASVHIWP